MISSCLLALVGKSHLQDLKTKPQRIHLKGQQISQRHISLISSCLRKWSHDFLHLSAKTKARGWDLDDKEHLDNRWLSALKLISAEIKSDDAELPRKDRKTSVTKVVVVVELYGNPKDY